MKPQPLLRYPKVTGTLLALISLLMGAAALLAADFGTPGWVLAPLLLWLATLGLPATLAVLLVSAIWGTAAPLYGFGLFCIVATGLAIGAEVAFVKGAADFVGGGHEN